MRAKVLAAGFAAALLLPAAAQAAECPKVVVTIANPEAVTDFHQKAPDGEPLVGAKLRFPGHFYDTTEKLTIKVLDNTYTVSAGSTFKFGCYGRSRTDKVLKPAVQILRGEVDVTTNSARKPGGIITPEGLFDPRNDPTMKFHVERALTSKNEPTAEDKFKWFANTISQPKGTTVMTTSKKGPIVGVTPYVGKNPGSCRYVHGAKLTMTGVDSKGFSTGTSSFTP